MSREEEKAPKKERIEVEQLLRIKRAERPDDRFWEAFDRDLHRRMLQTLVRKDPLPVQLLRGLRGRLAQSGAVLALVVAVALAAGHLLPKAGPEGQGGGELAAAGYAGAGAFGPEDWAANADERDFEAPVLAAGDTVAGEPVSRDFEAAPRLELAAYEPAVYSADLAPRSGPGVSVVY